MDVYTSRRPGHVLIRARLDQAGDIGDMFVDLRPGQSALGLTYDQWRRLKDGRHTRAIEADQP